MFAVDGSLEYGYLPVFDIRDLEGMLELSDLAHRCVARPAGASR